MTTDARPTVTPQLVIGVFITLLGVVLMLDQMAIVEARRLRPFWPMVLMAVGVAMLLQRRDPGGRFWGSVWTGIGGWMLLNTLGWLNVSLWQLIGPLILILIGANVMMHTIRGQRPTRPPRPSLPRYDRFGVIEPPAADAPIGVAGAGADAAAVPPIPGGTRPAHALPLQNDPSGSVTLFAVMGEAKRASNDKPFRGGEMTAFMGGCVLDLRQATILPGEQAVINVLAVMGGHEIWVPPGWAVASDLVPVLGGVDDKRLPPLEPLPDTAPRLRLRGLVLMGGVVIKH
jgi:predicted membrane protein